MFTPDQIKEMLNIMDKNTMIYTAFNIGKEVFSQEDKELMSKYGFDVDKTDVGFTPYEQSFYFARLSKVLGDKNAGKLEYNDLLSYLKKGQFHPMSNLEKEMLRISKMRTYNHLKGMTDKHKQQFTAILTEEMQKGIEQRKSVQNIVSELGHKTGDWQRDLGRIVETEFNTILQEGRAAEIMDEDGENALVYKDVYPGACRFCIKFYLTSGIGSKPRIFKLSDLINNGTNIGKKQADWVATLGSVHPHCFDKETDVLTNEGWKNWTNVIGNELFLSVDPISKKMEWVKANKLVKYRYKGILSHFKGFSFDLMTTDGHNHFIKNGKGNFHLKKEQELIDSHSFVNIVDGWEGYNDSYKIIGNKKILFDKYCSLMGIWLSDGSISKPELGKWQLKITQKNIKLRPKIEELLKSIFNKVWIGKDAFYVPLNEEEKDFFLQFGHAYDKFIPEDIKNSKKENIEIFMDSFLSCDGHSRIKSNKKIKSKEIKYYTTSSLKLESDLGEMIIKMGYRPSYFIAPPKPIKFKNGIYTAKHNQFNIYQNRSKTSNFKKISRHDVDYDDFVYDVELEKFHTLYVRRNGKVTISGNCRCNLQQLDKYEKWDEENKKFVVDKEKITYKPKEEYKDKITVGDKVFYV